MASSATNRLFQIMKAGWLHRRSDFLHRWKHSWVVVYTNGDLKYFESPDKYVAEETVVLPVEVQQVLRGNQCKVTPPEGKSQGALLSLVTPEKTWEFCAESPDDCDAWLMTIDEARRVRPASAPPIDCWQQQQQPPPPYADAHQYPYPTQRVVFVENGYNVPARIVQHPDGNTIVVYEDGRPPYCHRHCCYGCRSCCYGDAALGFAAGALLFSPFMWWPLWF